ncbi:hypothetical protein Gotur_018000 [Gossypium turneri]
MSNGELLGWYPMRFYTDMKTSTGGIKRFERKKTRLIGGKGNSKRLKRELRP